MGVTTDPRDPRLPHGEDLTPRAQADVYLVLSEEERARGFVRPVRRSYRHTVCRGVTTMGQPLAETWARDPDFYVGTYCATCSKHRPNAEFTWVDDGEALGS